MPSMPSKGWYFRRMSGGSHERDAIRCNATRSAADGTIDPSTHCIRRRCLRLVPLAALEELGLRTGHFGQLSYFERGQEYPRTQEIAEVAHFLVRDGLLVPSARWGCENVVVFCDVAGPDALEVVRDHGPIAWDEWRRAPLGR